MAYLHSAVIGLTVLGLIIVGHRRTHKTTAAVVSSAEPSIRKTVEMTIDSRVILELSAGYEEAADMTDSFVGRSAGGGKRTTAPLASKGALVNDDGSVGVIPCSRWNKYIESAVRTLSTHSMFG